MRVTAPGRPALRSVTTTRTTTTAPVRTRRGTPRAVLAVLLALTAWLPAAPAAADDGSGKAVTGGPQAWSVQPTDKTKGAASKRLAFQLDARPGTVIHDSVRVSNLSTEPLSFQVYGADAYNTPRDGGLAYRQAGEAQRDIGAWVQLGTNALVIPERRAADIPFTVTVPKDATPGTHTGGIVALDNALRDAGTTDSGVDVSIQRAIAVRLELTVAGPLTPGLSVSGVRLDHIADSVPFRSGRAVVRYTVTNTGNTPVEGTAAVDVTGLFGRAIAARTRDLPLVLPGQHTELTLDIGRAPPLDLLTAKVTVSGTGTPATTARVQRLALSWATVAVLVTVMALAAAGLSQIRRRRRTLAREHV
ncbi:WxL protein peptidoglycan domain-containing protein [Streptomyces sp. NPDC090106]|uniref:WxL protein peptidoglycan domain-containing protein n=1 Tax=Streptomyces sp. NPDC090106 TaxID=3365946 RepID=UPI0038079148